MIEICGIPYKVIECDDKFDTDAKHFGQVDFLKAEIRVNKNMAEQVNTELMVIGETMGARNKVNLTLRGANPRPHVDK